MVGAITGHNELAYFKHKLGKADSPGCRLCGEGPETYSHLVFTCKSTRLLASRWRSAPEAAKGEKIVGLVKQLSEAVGAS